MIVSISTIGLASLFDAGNCGVQHIVVHFASSSSLFSLLDLCVFFPCSAGGPDGVAITSRTKFSPTDLKSPTAITHGPSVLPLLPVFGSAMATH